MVAEEKAVEAVVEAVAAVAEAVAEVVDVVVVQAAVILLIQSQAIQTIQAIQSTPPPINAPPTKSIRATRSSGMTLLNTALTTDKEELPVLEATNNAPNEVHQSD